MTLGDDILDARGSDLDIGGVLTNLGSGIKNAQRFKLTDEVARALGCCVEIKPGTVAQVASAIQQLLQGQLTPASSWSSKLISVGKGHPPGSSVPFFARFKQHPPPLALGF